MADHRICKLYFAMVWSLRILTFTILFISFSQQGHSNLILFYENGNSAHQCVSRGGLILSREKISDYYFVKDGISIYVLPVPVTVSSTFADVQICDEEMKIERIWFRKKRRPSLPDIDKIKREKEILNNVYTLRSQKFWLGNFILPVRDYKRIIENFGVRREINGELAGYHRGIDISGDIGTKVFASNSGVVRIARKFTLEGNLVVIDHGEGIFSIYAHLQKIKVAEGDFVKKGQVIGTIGRSGRATGPHLHFGIKVGKVDVNPFIFFEIEDKIDKFLEISAGAM